MRKPETPFGSSSGIPPLLKKPLDMVINERKQLGRWGITTYCTFMDELFGHPTEEDHKPVLNPLWADSQRTYPHRSVRGVTLAGTFFVLRSTVLRPSETNQCVAFTGDVAAGEIRAWPVTEIIPASYSRQSTAYVLSRSASLVLLDQSSSRSLLGVHGDSPLQQGMDEWTQGDLVVTGGPYSISNTGSNGTHHDLHSIATFHQLLEVHKAEEREQATAYATVA